MPGIKSLILEESVVSLGRQTPALINRRARKAVTAWAQVADRLWFPDQRGLGAYGTTHQERVL